MRGLSVLREKTQRVKANLFGSEVSPEDFEVQLEMRAVNLEKRADHLEREAQLRKRAAVAKLRVREAEKEMGRGYSKALKIIGVMLIVLLAVFGVAESCKEAQDAGKVEQGAESGEGFDE